MYTPGPWTVKWQINVFSGERLVANTGAHSSNIDGDRILEENQANAILIAQAPDLLAQLERAVQLAEIASDWDLGADGEVEIDGGWVSCWDLAKQFKATIAAAKGDS